jgi:hypothetical protein
MIISRALAGTQGRLKISYIDVANRFINWLQQPWIGGVFSWSTFGCYITKQVQPSYGLYAKRLLSSSA